VSGDIEMPFRPGDFVQNIHTKAIAEVMEVDQEWLIIADDEGLFAVSPRGYALISQGGPS
jgi:hypothetical protein